MNTKKTTAAPAARKPRETAADKKERLAVEAAAATDKQAEPNAMLAERAALATTGITQVENWLGVLKTAVDSRDSGAARAAVAELITAAKTVSAAFGRRGSGKPARPRTVGKGRYQLIAEDGTYLRGSDYSASASRDRSQARRRLKDGVGREGDEALATAELVDTQAAPA